MNNFLRTLFILHLSILANADDISEMAGPCKIDNECVLFADECDNLKAVVKEKLPQNSAITVFREANVEFYSWPPGKKYCSYSNFQHPVWPKNSVAKCLRKVCVALTEHINKKKISKKQ